MEKTSLVRKRMAAIPFSVRFWRLKALSALAIAVSLAASQSAAFAASPFQKFAGDWSGSGQIVDANGRREVDPMSSGIRGGERRLGAE